MSSFQFWVEHFFLYYFTLINGLYTLFIFIAAYDILIRSKESHVEDTTEVLKSNALPPLLFIIPLHNDAKSVLSSIACVIGLTYQYKQIIIVNDGSDDDSMEKLKEELELVEIKKQYEDKLSTSEVKSVFKSNRYMDLTVIDKTHCGKYDAVNAALNACEAPLFVVLDSDTYIDNDEFESLVRSILTTNDVSAVGASIRIMNGCKIKNNKIITTGFPNKVLPALQCLEYFRAFCLRDGLNYINGNFIIAGAFSIFPTEALTKMGGLGPSSGEDVEVVVRLHRIMRLAKQPYKVTYFSDPVAYTIAPEKLKDLKNQRVRWQRGLLESIWFHKSMCFNPKYKLFGIFAFPFWLFGEALEPLVEILGITYIVVAAIIGRLELSFFILFSALSIGYTFLYSIYALCIEEFSYRKYPSIRSLLMLLFVNAIENFGYRQLLLFWRTQGFFSFIANFKTIRKSKKWIDKVIRGALKQIHPEEHKVDTQDAKKGADQARPVTK